MNSPNPEAWCAEGFVKFNFLFVVLTLNMSIPMAALNMRETEHFTTFKTS